MRSARPVSVGSINSLRYVHHCGAILITNCVAHMFGSVRADLVRIVYARSPARNACQKKGGESPPNDRNFKIYAADCPEALSLCAIQDRVVSSIRLEKPHSLSYHDSTFVRPPKTLV